MRRAQPPRGGRRIGVMSAEPLRNVRDHFSEFVDRVEHHRERVAATRNGRPVAVLISPDELAELEEALDVLSDPKALADIREADLAYAAGNVVHGADAMRNLRRRTRPGLRGGLPQLAALLRRRTRSRHAG